VNIFCAFVTEDGPKFVARNCKSMRGAMFCLISLEREEQKRRKLLDAIVYLRVLFHGGTLLILICKVKFESKEQINPRMPMAQVVA